MQDLKVRGVRGAWVHFPVGVTFWIFYFSRDSVESTESIEFKANYGKTRFNLILSHKINLSHTHTDSQRKQLNIYRNSHIVTIKKNIIHAQISFFNSPHEVLATNTKCSSLYLLPLLHFTTLQEPTQQEES